MSGQLINGLKPFGPGANCTLELCPLEASVFRYRPSVPFNAIFIASFSVLLIMHAAQGIYYKTWGYMAGMVAGCFLQIIGYAGRIMLYDNPFNFLPFLIQIVCITVAPVFYCAAVYILLSKTINRIDPTISRFDPRWFYWIFIPADIISLVLQGAGGGLSATGDNMDEVQKGVDVSLAGLIFQVIVLTAFLSLFGDYLFSYFRKYRGDISPRLKIYLGFMFLGVIFILIRCSYRIAELKEGYYSELFRDETKFIILESCIMCIAVFYLSIGHPGQGMRYEGIGASHNFKDYSSTRSPSPYNSPIMMQNVYYPYPSRERVYV